MTTRRLAAILAADVVGFSSMMEKDEEGTLARVKALQHEVIEPKVRERGGRLVKTTGDGFLCEFGSPVEAVRCALDIREVTRNGSDEMLLLRMGINLGDIIIEPDGDIYGDGVNVAARLEQLSEPGGICISGSVHEHAHGRVPVAFKSRGEQQVKNIARPISVYALAGAPRANGEGVLVPTDKPSMVVLPFTNMSGDPEIEYFVDGVVEEIITALSRVKWFYVIARNSSFRFKGRPVDVKQVGRELGVRYALEGSIRKAGTRVRITGQLIETATGQHVWTDRFEGDLEDIFELQDRITEEVVSAIEPSVRSVEIARATSKPSDSLDAYDLYLRALPEFHSGSIQGFRNAEALLKQAVGRDPNFADAWGALADCLSRLVVRGLEGHSLVEDACAAASKAVTLDPQNGTVLATAAWTLSMLAGQHQQASEYVARALKLHPNSAHVRTACGWVFGGEPERALPHFETARRLSPLDPREFLTLTAIGSVHFFARRFEETLEWTSRVLEQRPSWVAALRYRAAALAHLGRLDEAKEVIEKSKLVQPHGRIGRMSIYKFRYRWMHELFVDGLRAAGLPE